MIDRRIKFLRNATRDSTLQRVGVESAKGLVAVLSSDAENVFSTFSAKSLNLDIFVVARAIEYDPASKLIKAGAQTTLLNRMNSVV